MVEATAAVEGGHMALESGRGMLAVIAYPSVKMTQTKLGQRVKI
jgi:hypothetical protein